MKVHRGQSTINQSAVLRRGLVKLDWADKKA